MSQDGKLGTFSICSSLTQITIPSSVTYIDQYAFFECSLLTQVIFEKKKKKTEIKKINNKIILSHSKVNKKVFFLENNLLTLINTTFLKNTINIFRCEFEKIECHQYI